MLQFGPRKSPVRMACFAGWGACLAGAAFLLLGILMAREGAFYLVFFGIMGLLAGLFGAFFVIQSGRMARLHAEVTPDALLLTANAGRHLWLQRGLASAAIPWEEVQGYTSMSTVNIAVEGRVQHTCILYTKRGDFTLDDVQWENLAGLLREISARTGRAPGTVAAERAAAKADVQAGQRRLFSVQRFFGWTVVTLCAPLALLVLVGGVLRGFSADIVRAFCYLTFAAGLGAWLIRFYRK